MLRTLMIVSGGFELAFGVSMLVLVARGASITAGMKEQATLLGIVTVVLGLAALIMNNRLDTSLGMGTAYGLWLYNVIAALILIYISINGTDSLIRGGAAIHAVLALLFTYALFAPGHIE